MFPPFVLAGIKHICALKRWIVLRKLDDIPWTKLSIQCMHLSPQMMHIHRKSAYAHMIPAEQRNNSQRKVKRTESA